MKLFNSLKKSNDSKDTLATLIRAAQEDADFRKKLTSILKLDSKNRSSAINTMIHEMKLKKASFNFVEATRMLIDDGVAEKALELLRK